jgi:SEC-C motif-containing protein
MMCPCGSGKSYQLCCEIYHNGKVPEKADLLMRARYSAYAMGRSDFIIATTHPKHSDFQKNLQQRLKEIQSFSTSTQFMKLEVISFKEGAILSFVTFKATLLQSGKEYILHEKSRFEKIDGKWLYLSGEFLH